MTRDIFAFAATRVDSHIVELRATGSGFPLFCFPGSGGNVHIFENMVAALPEGQPVYAIDMEWLCDTDEDFSVERLAVFCLDQIRDIQKFGPYYLCGYSFGGLVAYEIATRLIEEGEKARLVALLDTPNPALLSNLSEVDSAQFRKTYLIDRIKKYCLQLARGDVNAIMSNGFAFFTSRAGRFFMPTIKTAFRMMNVTLPVTLRSNDPGFLRAWNSYIPKQYHDSVVCFRVEKRGPEHDNDPSMGWRTCAVGGAEVHVVPGGHVDMMSARSARVVADKLATYLDNASNHKGPAAF
jgi:thioesterase domain-containing protein